MAAYASKSLVKEKTRFVLSILGIGVAIALILIINGFASGLYKQTAAYYDNLNADLLVTESSTGMLTATSTLPRSIDKNIENIKGVKSLGSTIFTPYILKGKIDTPIIVIGSRPCSGGGPWKLAQGRNVLRDGEIVLDLSLALQREKTIGDNIEIFGNNLKIVGLSSETTSYMSSYAFISIDQLRRLTGNYSYSSYFLVKINNVMALEEVRGAIKDKISGARILTPNEISVKEVELVKELMSSAINIIVFIAMIIGVLVVGLTAYTATLSKVTELGVIKAIGGSNLFLYGVALKQTAISITLAAIVGLLLAYLVQYLIPVVAPQFIVYIDSESILKTSVLVILMAIVASYLPIRKISKIDPALVFK